MPAVLVSIGLAASVMLVYAPLRHYGFVNFDDPLYVSANPAVAHGLTRESVSWAFTTGHAGNWHPLTWLSHLLDVELFGLDAGAHHVTSVLLHAANTVLLYATLRRMTGALARSAFVAVLFGVHPLHVESVAWIAERKDVLSTLFFLLALSAYAGYVRRPRRTAFGGVLVLFALGLMAKPMVVTLPLVLLLLDFWPLGRAAEGKWSPLVREKLPLLALALASSVVTLLVQRRSGAVKGFDVLPFHRRVATAVLAYTDYIAKMVWPSRLAALYPYPTSIPGWSFGLALAFLLAASVAAIRVARRHPYVAVGWFWYLGTLVPVIGLVQVGSQPMADRYTYLPLVGLFLVVSWGAADLLARRSRRRAVLGVAALVVVTACGWTARRQVGYWEDSVALWEHALAVTTANARAEGNLGHALTQAGRRGDAIRHYAEALRLNPGDAEAHNNLGYLLAEEGRAGEALAHYSEALRLRPDYVEAHNNLGVALTAAGRAEEATLEFSEALRLDPRLAAAQENLGVALAQRGRLEEAIAHLTEAERLEPDRASVRRNLAIACNELGARLAEEGRVEEAIAQYSEALRLEPGLADARANLEQARDLARRSR